jgi:alpha-L-arabinofuranosidase
MDRVGHRMDGISLHYYTVTGWSGSKGSATKFNNDDYYWTMGKCLEIENVIKKHCDIMDQTDPKKQTGLLVDEWGTWWDEEQGTTRGHLYQQNALRDAFVAALTLNVFNKHTDRIRMANIAQVVNVLQSMILTNDKQMVLTPTYHVFEMYKGFQDATYLPLDLTCDSMSVRGDRKIPLVSTSAAKEKNGNIIISLANVSLKNSEDLTINLQGANVQKVTGRILTSKNITDFNDFDHPNVVEPTDFNNVKIKKGELKLKVPAKSIVVLELK